MAFDGLPAYILEALRVHAGLPATGPLTQAQLDVLHFGYPVHESAFVQPGRFFRFRVPGVGQYLLAQNRHQLYLLKAGVRWHPDGRNCPSADHLGECGCAAEE